MKALRKILDRLFPSRICARDGHKFVGWESMGPHLNDSRQGTFGGVYYALRYVVRCRVCGCSTPDGPYKMETDR